MVRVLVLVLSAFACAPADDNVEEDAAPAVAPAPAPSVISLGDVAGTWNMRAMREGSDSVATTYQLWASADSTAWRMKFDDRADTLAVRIMNVAGDSIVAHVGPYSSALRKNVMVETHSVYRLENGRLVGRSIAHYAVSTPDSVLVVRTEGTRAQ